MYLRVTLPSVTVGSNKGFRWLNWLGHILVKNVEIEIGGQRIDKQYGDQRGHEKHLSTMVPCAA